MHHMTSCADSASELDEHRAENAPAAWGDDRYSACGRCETCAREIESRRDPLLVAGMRDRIARLVRAYEDELLKRGLAELETSAD